MPTTEERLAYLEGKVEEHSRAWGDLKDMMIHLEGRIDSLDQKVDRFREELAGRITDVENGLGARITALDKKVDRLREELAGRITDVENGLGRRITDVENGLGARITALDKKIDSHFRWTTLMFFTILLALVGVLLKI